MDGDKKKKTKKRLDEKKKIEEELVLKVESLEEKRLQLEKKAEELENQAKRALADYANLKRRTEKERKDFLKFANSELLGKILPILDNLEEATKNLKDQGIDLIVKQFKEILNKEGIEEIKAVGEVFNPEVHEAVARADDLEKSGGEEKVVEVVEKGYFFQGKILRVAKVKVGKGNGDFQENSGNREN